MASITHCKANGHRTIQFVAANGKRKSIRLGKVSQRVAEEVRVKVEHLNAAVIAGLAIDSETAGWVAKIGDDLHAKLAAVGLVQPRAAAAKADLKAFIGAYIAGRTDAKANTLLNLKGFGDRLIAFFGADRDIATI